MSCRQPEPIGRAPIGRAPAPRTFLIAPTGSPGRNRIAWLLLGGDSRLDHGQRKSGGPRNVVTTCGSAHTLRHIGKIRTPRRQVLMESWNYSEIPDSLRGAPRYIEFPGGSYGVGVPCACRNAAIAW